MWGAADLIEGCSDRVTGCEMRYESGVIIPDPNMEPGRVSRSSLGPDWCQINLIIRSSEWDKALHSLHEIQGSRPQIFTME